MNGPRDIKDRELPRLPPGCQAILRRTVEAVINHTAVLKALETGGSALRLIATRRRLWWSFSRPSSAWLFRSMKENYSPLGLANISSPSGFTLLFVACVCMCQQPDNSRIPTRTAAVPENLAHPLGYFPTEKRVRIGYSPSVFGCANPGQLYVYAHLTRPPPFFFPFFFSKWQTTDSVEVLWRKGATGGLWIISKRFQRERCFFFFLFFQRLPLPFVMSSRKTQGEIRQWFLFSFLFCFVRSVHSLSKLFSSARDSQQETTETSTYWSGNGCSAHARFLTLGDDTGIHG